MKVSELIKQLMQCYSNATVLIKADNHDIKLDKVEDCSGVVDLIPDESLFVESEKSCYFNDEKEKDDACTEYPLDLMRWMASKGGVFEFNYEAVDECHYLWRPSQYSKKIEIGSIEKLYEQFQKQFGD